MILVIDDQAPLRTLLRIVLERAGHEETEAPNGRLGLAQYRRSPLTWSLPTFSCLR
jgi:CheY-like chemotaxis protein